MPTSFIEPTLKFPDLVSSAELDYFDEVIDVRSQAEFAEDHVPRALSHPVLDNDERALIGTLHKQASPFEAKRRGAVLVARNIATHIERDFASRGPDWRPLVYCWRGGKRSGAMTHMLRQIGWQAAQLDGGYKAYRREVVAQLETLPAQLRFVVICGETGSAKSRLLEALVTRDAQVLDLELLANHRGSVLGGVPGSPQPQQKMFETRIWDDLRRFDPLAPVFVESESKKVGQLQVPEALIRQMRAGECVRVAAPLSARVRFLLEEYRHFVADRGALDARLDCLADLHGKEVIERWKALAERGDEAFVADLLENHYDPAYRRSMGKNFPQLPEALELTPDDLTGTTLALLADVVIDAFARSRAKLAV